MTIGNRPTCTDSEDEFLVCEKRFEGLKESWNWQRGRRDHAEACSGILNVSYQAIEVVSLAGVPWAEARFEGYRGRDWSQVLLMTGPALVLDILLLPIQVAFWVAVLFSL